jgi:hypothetical protein
MELIDPQTKGNAQRHRSGGRLRGLCRHCGWRPTCAS